MFTVIVNLKNYAEATGKNFGKFVSNLPKYNGFRLIIAPAMLDLHNAPEFRNVEFFSQHVDDVGFGPYTGRIAMESLMDYGIMGSLLNHSERRLGEDKIISTVKKAQKLGFEIALCVESMEEARRYSALKPSFIAYEPKELIGGNVSVSTAKPEIVSEIVDICGTEGVPVLVGAGIKNGQDVRKSLDLGAQGILVSSGVVRSPDPVGSLNSLIK